MAFYKLCDCGKKNVFEQRHLAPRKCAFCGRQLQSKSIIDEDEEINNEPISDTVIDEIVDKSDFHLELLDGNGMIQIPRHGVIIGREAAGAEFVKEDLEISRLHFAVFGRGLLGLSVYDLSKNGTFVNGERVEKEKPKFAKPGDIIQIHKTAFRVCKSEGVI